MKLRVNKAALSIATAVLMFTSLLPSVGSASGGNEITLSSDKTSAGAGDSINVTVGYVPDDTGAAGFTLNLHYDSSKVEVYIPSDSEMQSAYNVNSKFSVITNYASSDGVVRIVGANLMSTNIEAATNVALATFKVKSGVSGDIDFWVDVETMVSSTDDGYVQAAFSCPTKDSPLSVSGSAAETTATTTTTTTTTVTTTTPAATTTTTAETTTTAATTTVKTTSEADTSTATTTTKSVSETTPAATTTTTVTTTAPAVTTAAKTTSQPAETTVASTTAAQTETTESEAEEASDEKIYSYTQGENDFNSEEDVSYSFSLSDYITDYSTNYDINVSISTTGNVNGGVGMLINDEWQSSTNRTHNTSEAVWTVENVNPNEVTSDVSVQLYYLKANSEFTIDSIEVVPVKSAATSVDTTAEEAEASTTETDEEINTEASSVTIGSNEIALSENTDITNGTADGVDETGEDVNTEGSSTEAENAVSETASTDDTSSEDASAESTSGNDTSGESTAVSSSSSDDSSAVEKAVSDAAVQAQDTDNNPSTGSSVRVFVMLLCGAEIAWSIFVIIYNFLTSKKED